MKFLFPIFSLFFNSASGYCQLKEIPVSKIIYQQEKSLLCLDSTGTISKYCSLDLDGFSVRFFGANFDVSKGDLQLIGRVCTSDQLISPGLSGIEIFKAKNKGSKLIDRASISETTDGKTFINNDGFFDVTLKITKNESIFFYGQQYFLKEFKVYKLLK